MRPPYLDTRLYYSLKCLTSLAEAGVPRQAKELAELTGITPAETAKILSLLAWGGFLSSKRGSKGGFWLRSEPSETRIKDVVRFLEPHAGGQSSDTDHDSIVRVWQMKVGRTLEDFEQLSLADLVRESHKVFGHKKAGSSKKK